MTATSSRLFKGLVLLVFTGNALSVANQVQLYAPPAGSGKDVPSIIAELKKFATEHKILKGQMIVG